MGSVHSDRAYWGGNCPILGALSYREPYRGSTASWALVELPSPNWVGFQPGDYEIVVLTAVPPTSLGSACS